MLLPSSITKSQHRKVDVPSAGIQLEMDTPTLRENAVAKTKSMCAVVINTHNVIICGGFILSRMRNMYKWMILSVHIIPFLDIAGVGQVC